MAEGHRKRLRERYLQGGISAVSEIEIIELLLYNAVPRKDTREIAEKLINKFGSIYNIIEAPQEEVESVESIGRSIAAFLHCLKDFIFFYNLGNVHPGRYFSMITDIGDYIVQKYGNVESEVFIQLCMDSECHILSEALISVGSQFEVSVSASAVVEHACRAQSNHIILAHNHPSGLAIPSQADIETTRQLCKGLNDLGIYIMDHIIFEKDDYVSLKASNMKKTAAVPAVSFF